MNTVARRHRHDALHCCPACAASVLGRPHAARLRRAVGGVPVQWAWLGLLALVAALVPLAALQDGSGSALAFGTPVAIIEDGPGISPSPSVPEVRPDLPASERPPLPVPPKVEWHDSVALGTPNAGSLVGGVRLPESGTGYYTYNPATQQPPGGADREWGTARLVREVLDLGAWWARSHPKRSPLGIGDLSREHGGPFTGPVVGHASHQNGLDVDIRLPRRDGRAAAADPSTYDRALTQAVVDRLVAQGASLVLVGPRLHVTGPQGIVMTWPNHDDHIHARWPSA